jgi:adenine-specific DNA methylase
VTETSEEYREWAKTQRFYGEGGKGSAFREAKTNSATAPVKGTTTGWRATCKHEDAGTQPCTVLDPFMGSGTTGMVARQLGRRAIGIDLNPEYLAMAVKRNALTLPMEMGL